MTGGMATKEAGQDMKSDPPNKSETDKAMDQIDKMASMTLDGEEERVLACLPSFLYFSCWVETWGFTLDA
jgi:hypothetical protein